MKAMITIKDQKGIALVTAILMLVVLSVIGIIAVNVTTIGAKITGNTRTSKQSFYLAEAGIEQARELLRSRIAGGSTVSGELNSLKGVDGQLVDSTNVANFSGSDDLPFINTTTLGNGNFRVFLTNDISDGVTSTADTNSQVTLTSFGEGPDNSRAVIQATVLRVPIPNLPGAITLPGPNVNFHAGNSNASEANGYSYPAIAVNDPTSRTSAIDGIPENRRDNYQGLGYDGSTNPKTPSVVNMTFPDPWGNLSQLQTLYQNLKGMADFNSPSNPGFTLGTQLDPKLVVIDGDYAVPGGATGAGILLVTGNLVFNGNIDYNGIILVIGKGSLVRAGAGNGNITGGVFVANIAGPDGNINTTADNIWGIPTWDTSGGGTSDIDKVLSSENNALQMLPFVKTSWRQLYQ
ncbi:MAG: pilus assembly PilX N-terminal domain-containing protein [Deltaproteobacteria bacterium]|nr:pilus assembly PilX N-terminal domain-containing protein [Deltaproteobacteria bacterium]